MTMTNIERRDGLLAEAQTLIDENPDGLAGDALARFDAIEAEVRTINARAEQIATVRALAAAGRTEGGDGAVAGERTPQGRTTPIPGMHRSTDPWEVRGDSYVHTLREDVTVANRAVAGELHGRALDAIEASTRLEAVGKERATHIVESCSEAPVAAAWLLAMTDPVYVRAFDKRLRHSNDDFAAVLTDEERHAWSRSVEIRTALTLANGSALVPSHLDPNIILTNAGSDNPYRRISKVVTTTQKVWEGVTSAGVTAEWAAEAAEAADATPGVGAKTITAHRADAYLEMSWEYNQDTSLANEIGMLIADAKDRLEEAAHATGTGSDQPYGIVTALGLVTASRVAGSSGAAGAADFVVGDLHALFTAVPPRSRRKSVWVAHNTTGGRIRQFATGTGPQGAFWTDLGADTPPLLLGRPFHESSSIDSTFVSGSNDDVLILGNFGQYFQIVDRIGLSIARNDWITGASRRPTAQTGFFAFWRTGSDVTSPEQFRMLRL